MKPPVRWHDDPEAPESVRQLLRDLPRSRPLPKDVRARSAARVDRLLVVPTAAGLLFWIKAVALAGSLATVGAVVVTRALPGRGARGTVTWPSPSRPSTPVAAPPPRMAAPPSAAPSLLPSALAVPSPASAAAVVHPPLPVVRVGSVEGASLASGHVPKGSAIRREEPAAEADSSIGNPLEREAALLESARAGMSADPARALAALELHAAEFPAGVLAMEREVLTVDALQRLGRVVEARQRARALLARIHGSPYERRLEALLDSSPGP